MIAWFSEKLKWLIGNTIYFRGRLAETIEWIKHNLDKYKLIYITYRWCLLDKFMPLSIPNFKVRVEYVTKAVETEWGFNWWFIYK